MSLTLELQTGQAHQRAALAQLIQLYVSDFSEFWMPAQRVHIQDDGMFPPFPHLDEYWIDPTRAVYFMRVDSGLAGFALLNRHSHVGHVIDVNVGEFFVARPYRREGVGTAAVAKLLEQRPGEWEVAISEHNVPAQRFWSRAIGAAGVSDVTRLEGDGKRWTGPILRFRSAARV